MSTHVEKTEGKSFGPVSGNSVITGAAVTLIIAIGSAFGVVIPAEVASAAVVLLMGAVAWYTKGRVEVREEPVAVIAAPVQGVETEPDVEVEPEPATEPEIDHWAVLESAVQKGNA